MRFAILGQHRNHFREHGYVEFEDLLTWEEVATLEETLSCLLPERPRSAWESIQRGRDLRRADEAIGKIARSRQLADVAAELVEERPLRLAYDQLLWSGSGGGEEAARFFEGPLSLEERSAFQGLKCGLLLALNGTLIEDPQLPSAVGNGIYFDSTTPIDWSSLGRHEGGHYWLLVYASEVSLYVLNEVDPHVQLPKRYGYGFGDRLRNEEFPLVTSR